MIRQVILAVAICFAIVNGQTFDAVFHNNFPPSSLPIGITSRTYGISLLQNPTPETSITVRLASTGMIFTPSSFTFTSTTPIMQSFSVIGTALGVQQINVTGDINAQAYFVQVVQRLIYMTPQTSSTSVDQTTNLVSFYTAFDDPTSDLAIRTNFTSNDTPRLYYHLDTPLSNDIRGGHLKVRSEVEGSSTMRFTAVGSRAEWYQLLGTSTPLYVYQRSITFPASLSPFKVGQRVTFQILLSVPSSGGLSVTPAGPGLFFEPATVNFAAGALSATVTVFAKFPSTASISYTVSGSDAALYTVGGFSSTSVNVIAPSVTCTPASSITAYKQVLHINCRADSFTDAFTITPSGEGMSFQPASVTFSAGCTSATFEMTPSVVGSIPIYYDISGDNSYASFSPSSKTETITVTKRIISITGPTSNIAGAENYVMISLFGSDNSALYPPYSSLTVTPCTQSTGLVTFEPSSLTFDNTMTVGVISVRPAVPGPTNVGFDFTLSGDDAYGFAIVKSYGSQVVNNAFDVKYYTDEDHLKQYQGLPALQSTQAFNVSVNNLVGNVTLTPESPVVTFSPTSYTFTGTDTIAYFNVTGVRSGTSYVTFRATGDSARLFTVPRPTLQITVLGSTAQSNTALSLASCALISLLCAIFAL